MAKDICWEPLPEMHGKIRGKSKVYFAHRSDTNTCYSAGVPVRTKPFSANQTAAQAKFVATAEAVKNVMLNPDQLSNYIYDFKHQTKYKTIRGYIFARIYDEGIPQQP